jgi:hypothetical protein
MSYMTDLLGAALAAAPQMPLVAAPRGRDLRCGTSIDVRCSMIEPFSPEGACLSLIRRLQVARGDLPDTGEGTDEYGYLLLGALNKAATTAERMYVESLIREQASAVEAIDSCDVRTALSGDRLIVNLAIVAKGYNEIRHFKIRSNEDRSDVEFIEV